MLSWSDKGDFLHLISLARTFIDTMHGSMCYHSSLSDRKLDQNEFSSHGENGISVFNS